MNDYDEAVREVVLCGIDAADQQSEKEGRSDRARAYFRAWVRLLSMGEERLPIGMQQQLGNMFDYLARGIIPGPIAHCAERGRRTGPDEERDIRLAVIYIEAAKRKLIDDKAPIKTVQLAFESKTRQNVQAWVTQYKTSIMDSELSEPEYIKERMMEAGARYAQSGRRQTPI